MQDLRFALRHLVKAPGFAMTAILTMTLGFGAAVAIYAFVDAALVAPLPFASPARLVDVTERNAQIPPCQPVISRLSRLATAQHGLSGIRLSQRPTLCVEHERRRSGGPRCASQRGILRTLGVAPIRGRDFYEGEDEPGIAQTAIISYQTWHSRLWRPSRHCRAHGHTRWQAVHNRRCASCGVSLCAARIRRVLDAIPRLRRLRRRARLPFPYRPGAVEGWGHHRDRAGGDGSHRGTARAAVSGHQQGTRRDVTPSPRSSSATSARFSCCSWAALDCCSSSPASMW